MTENVCKYWTDTLLCKELSLYRLGNAGNSFIYRCLIVSALIPAVFSSGWVWVETNPRLTSSVHVATELQQKENLFTFRRLCLNQWPATIYGRRWRPYLWPWMLCYLFLLLPSIGKQCMTNIPVCYWSTFIHLQTKRRPLYLKTQSVPRCKHFSSRL